MSRKVERAVGGLMQSLFGGLGTQSSLFGSNSGSNAKLMPPQPSLAFLSFIEQTRHAWKHSREAECQFFNSAAQTWVKELSNPNVSNAHICDILTRALIAACRGYVFPQIHIHAVKLAQVAQINHKKIGYLYVSVCVSNSELNVLLTNTLHLDTQYCDVTVVLAALSALPGVLAPDLPPQLAQSIFNCLHHPMSIIRRRACQVIYAGLSIFKVPDGVTESPLLNAGVVSSLLNLLSDKDTSVAIASTEALGALYTSHSSVLSHIRQSVSCSAAYILTQAFNGSLPRHYNRPPQHSHHVQLSMIRLLRRVNLCNPTDSVAPPSVQAAVSLVITQVVGEASLSVSMTLLEACLLTVEMKSLPVSLKNTALCLLLGFLQSDISQLRYCTLHLLTKEWSSFRDSIGTNHLKAVVETLHDSKYQGLKKMTLSLLCIMANDSNYQSVISTLLLHCDDCNYLDVEISNILKNHSVDVIWCYNALHRELTTHHPNNLVESIAKLVNEDLRRRITLELTAVALELVKYLLKNHDKNDSNFILSATLLETLNKKPLEDIPPSENSRSYSSLSLDSLNELFIDMAHVIPDSNMSRRVVFECLLEIGLKSATREKVILLLKKLHNSKELTCLFMSHEIINRLENENLHQKVICSDDEEVDWSLPFLEKYVLQSLRSDDAKLFIPPSVQLHIDRRNMEANDGFKDILHEKMDHHALSPLPEASSQGVPLRGASFFLDDYSFSPQEESSFQSNSATSSIYYKHKVDIFTGEIMGTANERNYNANRPIWSEGGRIKEDAGNDSDAPGNTVGTSGNTVGTSGNTVGTSGNTVGTSGNTVGTSGNTVGTSGNAVGTPRNTSSTISGFVTRSAPEEGIEVGAEASEDLSLNLNHMSITSDSQSASTLANALYAGLNKMN